MNTELMTRVADALAIIHDNHFDMRVINFHRPGDGGCGTPACVAGWTLHLAGVPELEGGDDSDAALALGLSVEEARRLFHPDAEEGWRWYAEPGAPAWITRAHAAAAARIAADEGEVPPDLWARAHREIAS